LLAAYIVLCKKYGNLKYYDINNPDSNRKIGRTKEKNNVELMRWKPIIHERKIKRENGTYMPSQFPSSPSNVILSSHPIREIH